MDVTNLIALDLPHSIAGHVVDFADVSFMYKGKRKYALKVFLEKMLTDEEKQILKGKKRVLGYDSVYWHKYAPEIKHSLFYVLY